MVYNHFVIRSFRHKGLEELYLTGKTRRLGFDNIRKCIRILQLLDVAERPDELNVTGFRFHALQGNPRRWSARVTGNYRVTFGWSNEGPVDVDFEDYH